MVGLFVLDGLAFVIFRVADKTIGYDLFADEDFGVAWKKELFYNWIERRGQKQQIGLFLNRLVDGNFP